jgi:hypothetical protein
MMDNRSGIQLKDEEDKKREDDCPPKQQTLRAPQQSRRGQNKYIRDIRPFFSEHYFSKKRYFSPV